MTDARTALNPLSLLGRFCLSALVLLVLWYYVSPLFVATLMHPVNGLLQLEHLPFALEQQDQLLLLACPRPDGLLQRFQFTGHETAFLTSVGAAALFAATPGYGWRWRARWLTGMLVLFWALDLLVLYAGAHVAFLGYLDSLSAAQRHALRPMDGWLLAGGSQETISGWIGIWSVWGSPVLLLTAWSVAVRNRLLPVRKALP